MVLTVAANNQSSVTFQRDEIHGSRIRPSSHNRATLALRRISSFIVFLYFYLYTSIVQSWWRSSTVRLHAFSWLCFSQRLLPLRRFALQATPGHDRVFAIHNIPLPQSPSPPSLSSTHQNNQFPSRSGALRLPSSQFSKSLSCVKRQSWIPNAQHSCNKILFLCNTFFKKKKLCF